MAVAAAQLAPARAHDVWLAPVTPPTGQGELQIGLFIGEHGRSPEALPFSASRLERLWLSTPLGEQEITVVDAQITLPAADAGHGARTLAYIGKPALSVLPAPKFDDYLREEHLQSILLQRQGTADAAHAADSSAMVSERYSRSLKLLLANAGQLLIDCPVGLPLELSVVSANDAEVVVLATFRGQPLAGLWVDRGAADGISITQGVTDANGRVALLRSDGDWVVRATHMLADDETPAAWRSWWATTAFRLGAAGVGGCEDSSM